MSLAEEIEKKLIEVLNALADTIGVEPGPDQGLGWGDATQGRIVVPMDVAAKVAAGVAEQHLRQEWLKGFAAGVDSGGKQRQS